MGGPGGQGGERVKDAGDDWSGHDTSLGVAHLVGLMMDRIGSPESRLTSSQSSLSSCESHSYALGALRGMSVTDGQKSTCRDEVSE